MIVSSPAVPTAPTSESVPAIYNDTSRQLRGMISFHARAERAYRAAGNTDMANAAKAKREQLEKQLEAVQS
jgi:hypothetical protein